MSLFINNSPAFSSVFQADSEILNRPHDVTLDALRIVSTLMVLLIHISGKGFAAINVPHWWAVNVYESISRICVPIFFMITGALLLSRSHDVKTTLKRAWRIVFVLLAWSFLFFGYFWLRGWEVKDWVFSLLKAPVAGHFWYLYTLIPAYFIIPVLPSFFRGSTLGMKYLVVAVWFIAASILPFVTKLLGKPVLGIDTAIFYIYPGYFLAGAVIYHHGVITPIKASLSFAVWLLATSLTAFFTWRYSKDAAVNTELFYEYFSPLVVLAAFSAFIWIRSLSSYVVGSFHCLRRLLSFLGGLSFGVYLLHPMIIWELENRGYNWNFTNPWVAIILLLLVVSLISGFIVFFIKKVPFIRAIVPG